MLEFFPRATVGMLLAALVGCGSAADGPTVTGVVTLDGQPLQTAGVTFVPIEGTRGRGAVGLTDQDGRFVARPPAPDRQLPAGSYRVTVSRFILPGGGVFEPNNETSPLAAGAVEQLPPRYSDPDASELTANLPDGPATFKFELTTTKKR